MDLLFNNSLKKIRVVFYNNNEINNFPETNIYYSREFNIRKNFIHFYKKLSIFEKLFVSGNEKLLLKAISLINNNQNKEALNILNNYDKKGPFLTDIYFIFLLMNPDIKYKRIYLEKFFNNLNSFGTFFDKYNITLNFCNPISEKLHININDNYIALLLYFLINILNLEEVLGLYPSLKENKYFKNTDHPLVQLILGELYLKIENYDMSIMTLQDISDNGIIYIYSLILLGKIFRKQGLIKSSIAILRKTRRRSNRFPVYFNLEGRYQLAKSLEKYNKYYLAKKEYEKILTIKYNYKDTRMRHEVLKNV